MTTTSGTVAPGAAAAQLYERYGNQIYRYCFARLRDREEAADAAQNTFLRVHVALEKGVVPRYETSWLYKIAHNVCLSWIESSGRRALVETPRDLDTLDESTLAAPASEHEAIEDLVGALAALPHNLRQAIVLREWQGLSYTEIAEAMNTTVPAVETLLVRARRQMAASLERNGGRLRRSATALGDVLGLRGLLSGSLAKLSAGAALVAVGGAGIGAVALSDRPSAPHQPRPPATVTQPAVATLPSFALTATPAQRAPARTTVVHHATHRAPAPVATHTRFANPNPAAPMVPSPVAVPAPPRPGPATTAPAPPQPPAVTATVSTPALTLPSLPTSPSTPTVSTPALPALPAPPQLPVTTTPALTTPALAIP